VRRLFTACERVALAQKWLLEKLPEISKKKICIGCIREEMEEMLKKTGTGPEVSLPRSA
jgi:hypothetical protein